MDPINEYRGVLTINALFDEELMATVNCTTPYCANQLLSIVVQPSDVALDPFDDADADLKTSSDLGKEFLDALSTYVDGVFAIQQRTFFIMLLVMGRRCRVLRWDRAGVATTVAFDYISRWRFFCDILWRTSVLARHAPDRLGLDPTATRIFPGDFLWQLMEEEARAHHDDPEAEERDLEDGELPTGVFTWAYVRRFFADSLDDMWPRYALKVPDESSYADTDGFRRFLVCKPRYIHDGLVGGGTRGYVALDVSTRRFRWLKDTWRAEDAGFRKEGDILAKLDTKCVEYAPTMICHGDLPDQMTHSSALRTANSFVGSTSTDFTPTESTPKQKREEDPGHSRCGEDVCHGWAASNSPVRLRKCTTGRPYYLRQHYRLVVAEVCMPFDMLISGAHLLQVIYNCISGAFSALALLVIVFFLLFVNGRPIPRSTLYRLAQSEDPPPQDQDR